MGGKKEAQAIDIRIPHGVDDHRHIRLLTSLTVVRVG